MACASLRPQIPILAPRLTFSGVGGGGGGGSDRRSRKLIVSSSQCGEQYEYEYRSVRSGSGLNSPLEPKSPAGKSLCRVLLDEPRSFEDAVDEFLDRLVEDRDGAIARMKMSLGSDDAALHRRIAELKEHECQLAVEDIMYMMVFFKFSEIKVPLIPRLRDCLYNGRLELLPSRDWQLESIHSRQVLEMVREYLAIAFNLKAGAGVGAYWSTTQVQMGHLSRVYAASVLFGYLLKSASLRHRLEHSLPGMLLQDDLFGNLRYTPEANMFLLKDLFFDRIQSSPGSTADVASASGNKGHEDFRCYLLSFGPETLQACAMPSSEHAMNLIENHCSALFWDDAELQDSDELILTSFSSLKRLVLEAIAFGSFLWDAERQVEKVCSF
ncbi:hypothetical protein Droror1_Dr00019010 [Drosera rotundifolia]